MIDLHVHSTFSDGTLTPTQLVEHGKSSYGFRSDRSRHRRWSR